MRKSATVVVATSLVVIIFAGIQPSGGQDPEGAEVIGVYHRLGSDDDLTSQHITWNDGTMEVEGPEFTDKLQVETTYLEEELGPWGSHQEFTVTDGYVEVDSRQATFEVFHLGEEPIFTQGAGDQVELLERPMWLSASQEAHGEQITLTMEDGDSSGQQVFISRDWLWGHGIQWFNVTHEDGSLLPLTEQSGGVVVDVPHFSELNINPDELDVKQVVEGVTVENLGETRWLWQESILEVDVDNNPSGDYEVLISADWLDLHIRPQTFNVYSSKELVDSDPDTGIQVCCGEGGSSQDYYSVKFSISGSSVMIEVIGEHLPIYTIQDGDLAPHWGEKRWNENTTVLEVDVEDQSSDYEVWVDKNWVDLNVPHATVLDYSIPRDQETIDGSEYFAFYLVPDQTPLMIVVEPRWETLDFLLNITEFEDKVDAGETITLPLATGDSVDLDLVGEPEPWEMAFNFNGDEGSNLTGERLYFEVNGEGNGSARFIMTDGLVFGEVCELLPGEVQDLFSKFLTEDDEGEGGDEIGMEVRTRNISACGLAVSDGEYPHDPPTPSKTRDVTPDVHMEDSYYNGTGSHYLDDNAHVDLAFEAQRTMWTNYTGNVFVDLPKFWSTSHWGYDNIEPADDIDGSYCKQKRVGFTQYIDDNDRRDEVTNGVFSLISGDSEMVCTGIARIHSNGTMPTKRDNVNYGLDKDFSGYDGRSNTDHMGVLIAQEIGHNWGHPYHECHTINGEYSAMADSSDCSAPWDDRKFWLHYEHEDKPEDAMPSANYIIDGTAGYDSGEE